LSHSGLSNTLLMVPAAGIEPATNSLEGYCSIH
jgi:hypothetical protein